MNKDFTEYTKTESHFSEIWLRICQITGWTAQHQLATFLNVNPSSISGAKQRGKFPIEWAFRIAQHFEATTDWIITGRYPITPSLQPPCKEVPIRDGAPLAYDKEEDWTIVPSSPLCALRENDASFSLRLAIPFTMAEDNQTDATSCLMPDDSMEPSFRKGDMLLIDRSIRRIDHSGIYALNTENAIMVKRIEVLPNGDIELRSDNAAYENRTAAIAEIRSSIFGRVVCHTRKL